jgi:hypothetical protein
MKAVARTPASFETELPARDATPRAGQAQRPQCSEEHAQETRAPRPIARHALAQRVIRCQAYKSPGRSGCPMALHRMVSAAGSTQGGRGSCGSSRPQRQPGARPWHNVPGDAEHSPWRRHDERHDLAEVRAIHVIYPGAEVVCSRPLGLAPDYPTTLQRNHGRGPVHGVCRGSGEARGSNC